MQLTDLNFKEWRHEIQKSNYEQTNFYDIGKIFSANNVIRLYEDLSQSTFSDWIVLCIELVESVESVAILESQSKARAEKHHLFVKMHHCVNLLNKKLFPQEAAFFPKLLQMRNALIKAEFSGHRLYFLKTMKGRNFRHFWQWSGHLKQYNHTEIMTYVYWSSCHKEVTSSFL